MRADELDRYSNLIDIRAATKYWQNNVRLVIKKLLDFLNIKVSHNIKNIWRSNVEAIQKIPFTKSCKTE